MGAVNHKVQASSNKKPAKVLVVDSDPVALHFMKAALGRDYDVRCTDSFDKAYRICDSAQAPHLVLCENQLKNGSGIEFIKLLQAQENTAHIPIMFVSDSADIETKVAAFENGAVDVVTKPFLILEFKARVAMQLKIKEQAKAIESLAYLDELTDVANRRRYNETMKREWARCIRYQQPFSLLIMDIDNFKAYNDHYGHHEGDQCLVKIAQSLRNVPNRPCDLFARYGGEEFVLVLPDCDEAGASIKAKQVQDSLSELAIPHNASQADAGNAKIVTMSIGQATVRPTFNEDALGIFQAADLATYEAKSSGRNRIVVAQAKSKDHSQALNDEHFKNTARCGQ